MALLAVSCLCLIFGVASIALAILMFQQKLKIARYSSITSVEEHLSQLSEQKTQLTLDLQSYTKELAKNKQVYARYTEVLGAYKSASEVKARQAELEKQCEALSEQIRNDMQKHQDLLCGATEVSQLLQRKLQLEASVHQISGQLGMLQNELNMQEIGLYRRIYDFEDPANYKDKLEDVRSEQRELVRSGCACSCSTNWLWREVKRRDVKWHRSKSNSCSGHLMENAMRRLQR